MRASPRGGLESCFASKLVRACFKQSKLNRNMRSRLSHLLAGGG